MKCSRITSVFSVTNTLKNKAFYFGQFANNNPTKTKTEIVKNNIDKIANELNALTYYTEKGLFVDERI